MPRWRYNQEEGATSASANSKIHKRDDYLPIVGRLWKTTRREDRRIVVQAFVDPTVTRSTIRADAGVTINPYRISRHLAEPNLESKHPFRALPLTPEHRQLRLQRCQARSMWNVTDWQKVVFSDESRFVLGTDDNRVRAWRCPALDSRSTLIVMRGTLTGQPYVDDILRPHVEHFLNGLPGEIFQQDNTRPHIARVAQDFLRHFQTLSWQSRSPDSSLVEHEYSMDCYFRQKWTDRRLMFDAPIPSLSLNIKMLEGIWKPDTYFHNGKGSYLHTITLPNKLLRIFQDGRVLYSMRKIGSRVGRNQTPVMRICDCWIQEGTTDRRGRFHPPQCNTSREDRQIMRMAVTKRSVTSRTIAQHIESVTHHSVSSRTICHRLYQSGLSARRPFLGLHLKQNHTRLRHRWDDETRMWVAE
ncbi:gamma-aminobutyric acid receptor alpha-like [Trichonephila clavipes]|nr:gamma-aminobutyric acid receptor alpha-like [Trichonephila clavipes]